MWASRRCARARPRAPFSHTAPGCAGPVRWGWPRPPRLALRGKTRRCVSAGGDTAPVIGKRRGPGGGLPRGLALLVAGAFFMEILDGTVIAPAAPLIAADLGIRAVDVNVAISGYLVTVAVLIRSAGGPPTGSARGGSSPSPSRCSPWPLRAARSPRT